MEPRRKGAIAAHESQQRVPRRAVAAAGPAAALMRGTARAVARRYLSDVEENGRLVKVAGPAAGPDRQRALLRTRLPRTAGRPLSRGRAGVRYRHAAFHAQAVEGRRGGSARPGPGLRLHASSVPMGRAS
jgi:hypothetical protein